MALGPWVLHLKLESKLSLINAQPGNLSKKGADRRIDGNINFAKTSRAIVSVKANSTSSP